MLRTFKFFALGYLLGEVGIFRTLKTLVVGALLLAMALLYVTKDAAVDLSGSHVHLGEDGRYPAARDPAKDLAAVLDGR